MCNVYGGAWQPPSLTPKRRPLAAHTYGIVQLFNALDDRLVGEVQLVGGLYEAHAVAAQLAEHLGHIALSVLVDQYQATVHQAEGARPPDSGTAVHYGWTHVAAEAAGVANLLQELKECVRRAGNAKVRPCGVVELHHFTTLLRFEIG